jgi:hypothetical protein
MSTQTFKIRKVGGNFVAFDTIDKKRSYGRINIKTGKFVGDTRCLIVLSEHRRNNTEIKNVCLVDKIGLVDKVLDRIKQDVNEGDVTAIEEMLTFLPSDILKGYLAED